MEVGITILQNCYEFDVLVMATLLRTLGKKTILTLKYILTSNNTSHNELRGIESSACFNTVRHSK